MSIINLVAGNIAIKYGLKGPCTSMVTACATGTNNIGDAFRSYKAWICRCYGMLVEQKHLLLELAIAGFTWNVKH